MTKPLVSVLIDTYNHEGFIEQTLLSALEQDCPASEFEIVVVDDGSTDRTPEIVRKFAPRVRLLRKKNGGQASAFNAAFPEVCGEAVAFLDGDDWWVPEKLSIVAEALEENPQIAGVGHGYYEFHQERGEVTLRVAAGPQVLCLETPAEAKQCLEALPTLHKGAFTVRTSVLRECMPIPERLIFNADTPIAMAAMARSALILNQPLYYYRIHSNNLDAVGDTDGFRARRKLEMADAMYDVVETMLGRMGIAAQSISAAINEPWVSSNRHMLRTFGGKRTTAFQTEMRQFHREHENPSLGYSVFKYGVVGAATLLVSPRTFYSLREWYGQHGLGRFREQLVRNR